jgi:hypothetical protein
LDGLCQVCVGTSNGCAMGGDYQGITRHLRPNFLLRLFNFTTPVITMKDRNLISRAWSNRHRSQLMHGRPWRHTRRRAALCRSPVFLLCAVPLTRCTARPLTFIKISHGAELGLPVSKKRSSRYDRAGSVFCLPRE